MHLFVTGTDTNIGKTLVSIGFAFSLHRKYWKPVQSGTKVLTDSEKATQQLGLSRVIPEFYRLKNPLSPHLASKQDGVQISVQKILEFSKKISEPLIIEGSGGILVPLNEKELVVDLIKGLNCLSIVVARSTLGTINHTLLTLEAMRSRDLKLGGVVLVGPPNLENKLAIEKYGATQIIAEVPWFEGSDDFVSKKLLNYFIRKKDEKWNYL